MRSLCALQRFPCAVHCLQNRRAFFFFVRACVHACRCIHRFARHRRLVAFVFPGLIAHIIWWSYAASHPSTFDLFTDETSDTPNWYMCVTMAFGSMVAGATSEVRNVLRGMMHLLSLENL